MGSKIRKVDAKDVPMLQHQARRDKNLTEVMEHLMSDIGAWFEIPKDFINPRSLQGRVRRTYPDETVKLQLRGTSEANRGERESFFARLLQVNDVIERNAFEEDDESIPV